MRTSRMRHVLGAALAVLALTTAACGDDDDSTSGGGGGDGAATPAAEDSAGYEKAQADFKEFQTPQGFTEVPPVGKDIPTGKKIDFVICGPASCVPPGEFTKAAGEELGWDVNIINGGLTPESQKAAMAQAVKNKPDGVVYEGLDASVFQPELQALKDANIPVVAWQTADEDDIPKSWVIPGRSHYDLVADMAAAAAMVAGKGKPVVGYIQVPAFPIYKEVIDPAVKAAIAEYCADCEVKTLDLPPTAIGKDAAARITGFIRGEEGINVLIHDVGLTALGVDAAMQGAGIEGVEQVVLYGTSANLPEVKNGTEFAFIPDPFQEMGWMVIDSFARVFTGGSPQATIDLTAPAVTWTKDNVPDPVGNNLAASQPGFQDLFLEAWGK